MPRTLAAHERQRMSPTRTQTQSSRRFFIKLGESASWPNACGHRSQRAPHYDDRLLALPDELVRKPAIFLLLLFVLQTARVDLRFPTRLQVENRKQMLLTAS